MAWVSTTEHVDGRSGSMNELQIREYGRVFTVVMSNRLDGPDVVLFAPDLPRMYDPYVALSGTQDLGALVRLITPERTESPLIWKVSVKYSSDVESLLNANPLLRPPEISWSTVGIAIAVGFDVEGNPIRNTAGLLFDPPLEVDESRLVLRISRNLAGYDAIKTLKHLNTINSRQFLDLPPYSTKCMRLDGTRLHENGKLFWRWDCEFHIRKLREPKTKKRITPLAADEQPGAVRSWTAWILNRGLQYKPLTGTGWLKCRDGDNQQVSSPVPLAENGTQLPNNGTPLYLGFDFLKETDFNELGVHL